MRIEKYKNKWTASALDCDGMFFGVAADTKEEALIALVVALETQNQKLHPNWNTTEITKHQMELDCRFKLVRINDIWKAVWDNRIEVAYAEQETAVTKLYEAVQGEGHESNR